MKNQIKRRLVIVRWQDHFNRSGWHDADSPDLEPLIIETVGWVVGESDEMISLSPTITQNGRTDFSESILKCAIEEVWEVSFK